MCRERDGVFLGPSCFPKVFVFKVAEQVWIDYLINPEKSLSLPGSPLPSRGRPLGKSEPIRD
jgi:hypothetical protein